MDTCGLPAGKLNRVKNNKVVLENFQHHFFIVLYVLSHF